MTGNGSRDEFDFDLCVIGSGPAGYAAAMRAWDFGKRVCLVERGEIGGAGIHNGALSSKTLWELSHDYRKLFARDRGYAVHSLSLEYDEVNMCVRRAVDEKVWQLTHQLEELSRPRENFPGSVSLVRGHARFIGPHELEVEGQDRGKRRNLTSEYFIIATGSTPRILDDVEVDGHYIMTSDHLMNLDHFPESMVIIGAGITGCEFATIFSNFGQTKIYLIDRADRILPFEDEDIARICSNNLEAKGVTVHNSSQFVSIKRSGGGVEYTIRHPSGGRETIGVERAVLSVGRVPNTGDLGLDAAGVERNDRGYIKNEDGRTTAAHIYAVGDVTFDPALVSVGEIEGRHAVERIWGNNPDPLEYDNISTIVFLEPELAAIGLNEMRAQEKRIPYRAVKHCYSLVNRAIAMRSTDGVVKLLVSDDDQNLLLGLRVLGPHASSTIQVASLIIHSKRSVCELGDLLHPHPAITEIFQECVRMLEGTSVYKPHVFKSELRLSRVTYDD